MPPIPADELWAARLSLVGFWLFGATKIYCVVFLVGDLLMTGRLFLSGLCPLGPWSAENVLRTADVKAASSRESRC